METRVKAPPPNYRCLSCFHSRIDRVPGVKAENLPIRCVVRGKVAESHDCKKHEAADGRMV